MNYCNYFQLRAQGFEHIDALDPSATMLSVAKKNNLYENYFCEFLTDKELPIAPGKDSCLFFFFFFFFFFFC